MFLSLMFLSLSFPRITKHLKTQVATMKEHSAVPGPTLYQLVPSMPTPLRSRYYYCAHCTVTESKEQ